MWYCGTKLRDHELIEGNASCAYQAEMNSNIHAPPSLFCICFPLSLKYAVNLMLEIIFEENLSNADFSFELYINISVHV